MYGIGEPVVEFAMVRGADGRERQRPSEVREIARRVQGWISTTETCRSCSAKRAATLESGWPLCKSCSQHKAERLVRREPSGETRGLDPAEFAGGLMGTGIVFRQRSENLGGFVEEIDSAAVDYTLENGPVDVRYLWSHDSALTLGRTTAGTLALAKTRRGIEIGVKLPAWAVSQREMVDRRDVSGQSFGFMVKDDVWELDDDMPVRTVLSMEFHELSGVSFPAYPQTTLDVAERVKPRRSLRWLEQWLRTQAVR